MGNDDRGGLRYHLRAGVALGLPDWNQWLTAKTQEHRADLVVIDTAASATAIDLNDNTSVAALYRDALRPATLNGAAILLLHHERKAGDYARNAGQAMMGARQWAGQADGHLAIRATGRLSNEPVGDTGRTVQRYPIEMEMPKVRDGQPALPAALMIVSERDEANRLAWMRVDAAGEALAGASTPTLADRIVTYVNGTEAVVSRAEVADALNVTPTSGSFKTALKAAAAAGRIKRVGHGQYAAKGQ
jgi:hypothetical protein